MPDALPISESRLLISTSRIRSKFGGVEPVVAPPIRSPNKSGLAAINPLAVLTLMPSKLARRCASDVAAAARGSPSSVASGSGEPAPAAGRATVPVSLLIRFVTSASTAASSAAASPDDSPLLLLLPLPPDAGAAEKGIAVGSPV